MGELVMYLKNDYCSDLPNGSLGTVTVVNAGEVVCDFGGIEQRFAGARLVDLMLAYAMNVHKSQRSQFGRLIVPGQRSGILDRTLVDTAVTRAMDPVVLVGDATVLAKAVMEPPSASMRRRDLSVISEMVTGSLPFKQSLQEYGDQLP